MSKLSADQVAYYMNKLPKWKFDQKCLTKTVELQDFKGSINFVLAVAELAEKASHHPEIQIQKNRVKIILTSYDSDGVTGKDFLLAQQIDVLL